MNRTIVISDVHGCVNELNGLLEAAEYDSKRDQLLLIGDYVDRGPNSKETVKRVMELVLENGAIALRGNHDQRFVDLVRQGSAAVRAKFAEHGGMQTLASYCGTVFSEGAWDGISEERFGQLREEIAAAHGQHIAFLGNLPLYHEDEGHIYAHAGINPRYEDWKQQPEHDFMYIKSEFYENKTGLEKTVVFGHTRATDLHGSPEAWFGGDKIGIDGGCAYGKQLNALIIGRSGEYRTLSVKKG